jgi:hypothetical protein
MLNLANDPDRQIFCSGKAWQDVVEILVIKLGNGWQDGGGNISVVLHPSAF